MAWRARPRPQVSVRCRGRRSTTTSSSTSARRSIALRRRSYSSRPLRPAEACHRAIRVGCPHLLDAILHCCGAASHSLASYQGKAEWAGSKGQC